jgi:polyisoprenoid-binding protein YceI
MRRPDACFLYDGATAVALETNANGHVPFSLRTRAVAHQRPAIGRTETFMSFIIDEVHSHVGFSVKHMMVATVRGQFRKFSGKVQIDAKDFARSSFQGEIDVASVDTGNVDRDNHLRTGDFFDAPTHPKILFKSTRITPKEGNEYTVRGDITIRGVTKPITLDVEFFGTSKNPYGKTVAGLSASGTINRKDFGVNFNAVLETGGVAVGEKVKLDLELEAIAVEDAQPIAATA